MKDEDVQLGMKVVPHSKSAYHKGLESSPAWLAARANGQNFLYVIKWEHTDKWWMLNERYDKVTGDYFLASDFEPYEE
jgi:hypothetical protein